MQQKTAISRKGEGGRGAAKSVWMWLISVNGSSGLHLPLVPMIVREMATDSIGCLMPGTRESIGLLMVRETLQARLSKDLEPGKTVLDPGGFSVILQLILRTCQRSG